MRTSTSRLVLGLGVPALILGSGFGTFLATRSGLPDPVANHFGPSGRPDGALPLTDFLILISGFLVFGALASVVLALLRSPMPPFHPPVLAFVAGVMGGVGAAIAIYTGLSQRGLDRWEDARLLHPALLLAAPLPLVVGAVAAHAAASLPVQDLHPDGTPRGVDALDLGPDEHAVWTSTTHARWIARSGLAVAAGLLILAAFISWAVAIGAVVVAVATTIGSLARIRADRNGLMVTFGPGSWPSVTIPIGRIERATVIDVEPRQWGGWGYRGSLTLMTRAAVVMRGGPGIRLDLTDGKIFVVTVDDPEQGAALLNAEARRAPV